MTNANATFNTVNTVYTQAIASSTWTITNQYIIGQTAADTGSVTHTSGSLVVTNSAGTGTMIVGQTGNGVYSLQGGTVTVDHLFVTNTGNSDFLFSNGTLNIRGDSIISNNSNPFKVGIVAGMSTLNISGGAVWFQNGTNFLGNLSSITSVVTVTGANTIMSNTVVFVGNSGIGSQFIISNGATVVATKEFRGGANGSSNIVLILDGGKLFVGSGGGGTTGIGGTGTSGGDLGVVSGAGSMWTNGGSLVIGRSAKNSRLIVSNGGLVFATHFTIGNNSGADSNSMLITDSGSAVSNTVNNLNIGGNAAFSSLMVSNGATLVSANTVFGTGAGSNQSAVITGLGTLWKNTGSFFIGTNASSKSSAGTILILDQATLEPNTFVTGIDNSSAITNLGGIIQFASANPTITTNSDNSIILTNATLSYRGITNAPIHTTNQTSAINFQGNNTFMLNSASNAVLESYTFTNGFTSTNFTHLTLINTTTRWQATNTTFGAGSTFLITNTTATVFGQVTNSGAIRITASTATFVSNANLIGSGTLAIDATSTLNFHTNTVYVSGAVTNAGAMNLIKSIATFQGQMDSPGNIAMDANSQLTFSNLSGTTTIAGVLSGAGSLQKYGAGTVILSGNNTFTGAVTNGAGTLQINSANGLGATTALSVQGGTMLFNTGVTNTSANVVLNGGEIQELDKNISLGTLTVSANSSITLTAGGAAGSFRFASATNTVGAGATLTIYGWSYDSANDKGSDDLIFFTDSAFETASFLNNVTFFGLGPGARILSTGELVPLTPEPGTLFIGWLISGILAFKIRRKIRK